MFFYDHFSTYLSNFSDDEILFSDCYSNYTKRTIEKITGKFINLDFKNQLVVGILVKRNIDYIVIYTIFLSLGITVVPLNALWGEEYLTHVIQKSKINSLIIEEESSLINKISNKINIYLSKSLLNNNLSIKKPKIVKENEDILYIVFTSGTTGTPKGVKISKKSFLSYFKNFPTDKFFKKNGYHLITGEINFDIILADLVICIKNSRKIFIQNNKDIFNLCLTLLRKDIISTYFVPNYLKSILSIIEGRFDNDDLQKKLIIFYSGGEELNSKLCKNIKRNFKSAFIYNNYGPSEVTINCLHTLITDKMIQDNDIPTGLPFARLNYSFNDPNKICSVGETGELLVGGEQVMNGYIDTDNNKLCVSSNNKTFYRTGDIFEYGLNGYFYYKGRIDNEVKVLGNRVNLESLREVCLKELDLEDIIFLNYKDQIICYVVGFKGNKEEIKNNLLRFFPKYVLPKKVIELKKFPVNKNGKIDYKKLSFLN